jgi:mono/diheme cytochrome c family protein
MIRLLSLLGALALVTVAAAAGGCATAAAQPPTDQPGRMIFFSQGCYGCHRIGPAGTPIAHDLSHIGRKYSEAELVRWLREPSAVKAGAHMPRLALTDDEIRALASYLASLR